MCEISAFFYGSLTSGNWNSHFCRSCLSVESALVCGRIYQLSAGFPAMQVPAESILALGTRSPEKDARLQAEQNSKPIEFRIRDGWHEVHGELVTFGNPEAINPIDRLEGMPFYYLRVLIPVRRGNGETIAAWVYIMQRLPPGAKQIKSGHWRPHIR